MEKVCNEKVKCWVEVAPDDPIALAHGARGYDIYVKCGSVNPNDEYGDDDPVFCDKCYMEKNPGWEKTGWRPQQDTTKSLTEDEKAKEAKLWEQYELERNEWQLGFAAPGDYYPSFEDWKAR